MKVVTNDRGYEFIAFELRKDFLFKLPFQQKYKNIIITVDIASILLVSMAIRSYQASPSTSSLLITLAGIVQGASAGFTHYYRGGKLPANETRTELITWQSYWHFLLLSAYSALAVQHLITLFLGL